MRCSTEKISSEYLKIRDADTMIQLDSKSKKKIVSIETNIEKVKLEVNEDWCSAEILSNTINITIQENTSPDIRVASIEILAGTLQKTIKVEQLGTSPVILIDHKNVTIDYKKLEFSIHVTSNVDYQFECSNLWIKEVKDVQAKSQKITKAYKFKVDATSKARVGYIYFSSKDLKLKDTIVINQNIVSDLYESIGVNDFERDQKIGFSSVVLTPSDTYQNGEDASKTIDGDINTLYHSPWGGMDKNTTIKLEYDFNGNVELVNYVVIYPRTMGTNGIPKKLKISTTDDVNANYTLQKIVERGVSSTPFVVRFDNPIINPKKLKIEVEDANGEGNKYFVSIAEVEAYKSMDLSNLSVDFEMFTDPSCSELKSGVTPNELASMKSLFLKNLAHFLYAGKYDKTYRIQNYTAYRPLDDLRKELKINYYNQFENPTGIYFEKDERVVVFVGKTNGQQISLRVTDFSNKNVTDHTYSLTEGFNVVDMESNGNGYISYFTEDYESASDIKVHIASGQVNGFFDKKKNTNLEGEQMLLNAVSPILDIVGERVNLAYTVNSLNKYCSNRILDLITEYDKIIKIEHKIMGLDKYNRVPKNHMFGRVVWNAYMYADGWGAGFNDNTMHDVADVDKVKVSNWGIAHEFGHVNQVRPGMLWVGTTECTNNIYSAIVQKYYTPNQLRLEDEFKGGRFNAYLNNALVKNQEWGLQGGPDKAYGANDDGVWNADHFVKLCMFWQLHLFYDLAGEGNSWQKPNFWADIFEKVRVNDDADLTHGQHQINFVKYACDAVQQDLSEFFIKTGVLKPIDKLIGDYSNAQKTITQEMIDDVVSYISKYPKPATDFIYYISGNSIDAYKAKKSVIGVKGQGVSGTSEKIISHSVWKNVTVFETYNNNDISHLTMVNSGFSNKTSTKVPYPLGSTRIEAVAWDGTRTLVYGTR
jgi:hypothetical protein